MAHWMRPERRGLSGGQYAPPPQRPAYHNDLGSRMARLEEHANIAAWDRGRIERESLLRDQDLMDGMRSIKTAQEQNTNTLRDVRLAALIVVSGSKYLLAIIFIVIATYRVIPWPEALKLVGSLGLLAP